MTTHEQLLLDACAAALEWWHDDPANFDRQEPAFLEQMRAIPGVRERTEHEEAA